MSTKSLYNIITKKLRRKHTHTPYKKLNHSYTVKTNNPYKKTLYLKELDGVGPVDNRPSTDKLHHFVRKKNK